MLVLLLILGVMILCNVALYSWVFVVIVAGLLPLCSITQYWTVCCHSVFHWDHVCVIGLSVTGVSHEWFLLFVWYFCWVVFLVLCITWLWVVLIVYLCHDIVCTISWCYKRWSGGSQQRSSQCALPPAMPTAHRPGWPRHERCRTVLRESARRSKSPPSYLVIPTYWLHPTCRRSHSRPVECQLGPLMLLQVAMLEVRPAVLHCHCACRYILQDGC